MRQERQVWKLKPIKLVMSAFGPYAKTMPAIVFSDFEERGLFLISGETGAGKTTIFDAVAFALFGQAGGEYKKTKYMKSEFADAATPAFVEFTFEHRNKIYSVNRSLPYSKPKKKGNGFTDVKEKAVLQVEGDSPVEGLKEVNARIQELLNIDFNQFKQVALIAQGEFWNLLNASTDDRTKILRNIFLTDGYDRITSVLKNMQAESFGEREDARKTVVQLLKSVKTDEESELTKEFESKVSKAAKTSDLWNLSELLDLLDRIIEEDKSSQVEMQQHADSMAEDLQKAVEKLTEAKNNNLLFEDVKRFEDKLALLKMQGDEINVKKLKIEKALNATNKIEPLYVACSELINNVSEVTAEKNSTKMDLTKAMEEEKKAEEESAKASEKEKEVEEALVLVNEIKSNEENYKARDKAVKDAGTHKVLVADLEKALEKAVSDKESAEESIKKYEKAREELKDCGKNLANAENFVKMLARLSSQVKSTNSEVDQYILDTERLKVKQAESVDAIKKYELASEKREEAERILDCSRAGILAKTLTEGSPCPVCGSTSHPKLAVLPEKSITEDEFKAFRKKEDIARKLKEEVVNETERLKAALEERDRLLHSKCAEILESELIHFKLDIGDDWEKNKVSLETLRKGVKEAGAQAVSKFKKAEAEKKKDDGLLLEIGKLKDTLPKKEADIEGIRKKLEEAKLAANEDEITLKNFSSLKYDSWEAAEEGIKKVDDKINAVKEEIKQAETILKESRDKETELKTKLAAVTENLDKAVKAYEDKKAQFICERDKYFESDEDFLNHRISQKKIESLQREVSNYEREINSTEDLLFEARNKTEGRTFIDLSELEEKKEAASKIGRDATKKLDQIENRLEHNIESRDKIKEQGEVYDKADKINQLHKRLYNLVSGNVGNGNIKITLEQYVQKAGFDAIIAAANKRLLPMSDGQFELYRKQSVDSKRSKEILDLEVLDNLTGKRRPVGNLSGGESFKASLSLALGLSDMVSMNRGGIQMDALFIDEGFGTLDKKSIENALDVLMGLSGKGKLVGLISHREELIECIPDQIYVHKDKNGSGFDIIKA